MNTLQALLTRGLTLCALLGIGLVAGAEAGTWHVGPAAGPGVDFTDIQSAVDAASEGDTIEIDAGTYLDPVVIDGKSVTLQGFLKRGHLEFDFDGAAPRATDRAQLGGGASRALAQHASHSLDRQSRRRGFV